MGASQSKQKSGRDPQLSPGYWALLCCLLSVLVIAGCEQLLGADFGDEYSATEQLINDDGAPTSNDDDTSVNQVDDTNVDDDGPIVVPNDGICRSCDELGAECGEIEDGCGHTLICGNCSLPNSCVSNR